MRKEPSQESVQVNPKDTGVKPATIPKGTIFGKNGSIVSIPYIKRDRNRLDWFGRMKVRYSKSKKTQKIGE